jgi:predicted outer membrane repeat protein
MLVAFLPRPASGGQVWVIQGSGSGHYHTVQAAVDAAADGGILVVGAGTYPSFSIDGKSLVIYAAEGADVEIAGTVEIKNIASSGHVLLAGLSVTAAASSGTPALRLTDDLGHVRFSECSFLGGQGAGRTNPLGCGTLGPGGAGAIVTGCLRVAFTRCTLTGGQGGSEYLDWECEGGAAGDAIAATNSVLCLYQCTCTGGHGGDAGDYPGSAGRGCSATGNGLLASGCVFQGGHGGDGWDGVVSYGTDGGDGVVLDANTGMHSLDCAMAGGLGGTGYTASGNPGAPTSGAGDIVFHAGASRSVRGPRIVADASAPTLTFHGTTGDQMIQQGSSQPDFHLVPTQSGFRLVLPPLSDLTTPVTVVAPSGDVTAPLPIADLQGPTVGVVSWTQARADDAQGTTFLASPLDLVVLNRNSLPDCNGNGVLDYFDVLEGTSADCDHDLVPDECGDDCNANLVPDHCDIADGYSQDCNGNDVPDECDLASGTSADCNGNHVPDSCDIASGTSQDHDHDGIPDECQAPVVHYVKPDAAAGGDGSYGAPFRTIRQAIDVSQSGDTVALFDGVYSTPDDRELAISPLADLVVKSLNGPARCIIDCQGAGRAILYEATASHASILQGITILHAWKINVLQPWGGAIEIDGGSPVIRGCVFRECTAGLGGAVYVNRSQAVFEDCVFENNWGGAGAAMWLRESQDAVVRRCRFEGNFAAAGGALYVSALPGNRISHCSFLSNAATTSSGGACFAEMSGGQGPVLRALEFDDCLFAGNSAATNGGALSFEVDPSWDDTAYWFRITSSTLADNQAAQGGAIASSIPEAISCANSIFWGNAAINGSQIALLAGSTQQHAVVAACDVQGGQAGIYVASGTLTYGAGNLALDPRFTIRYELSSTSPCIDAGDDTAVLQDRFDIDGDGNTTEPVPLDLGLRSRFLEDPSVPNTGVGPAPILDMGAFEFLPPAPASTKLATSRR